MNLTGNKPRRTLCSQGHAIIRYASCLLAAAGLRPDRAAVLRVVESAPHTPAEGDHPCLHQSFCVFLLAAAEAQPMTQDQFRHFAGLARFWLDVVPSWHPRKRCRLERQVRLALTSGE